MQEILSKTVDPKVPLRGQEFYELRFDDLEAFGEPRYVVQQTRIRLNDESGKIERDSVETEVSKSLQDAKKFYSERLRALADKGFIHSDLDPIL